MIPNGLDTGDLHIMLEYEYNVKEKAYVRKTQFDRIAG
jgi:hypothetical protein